MDDLYKEVEGRRTGIRVGNHNAPNGMVVEGRQATKALRTGVTDACPCRRVPLKKSRRLFTKVLPHAMRPHIALRRRDKGAVLKRAFESPLRGASCCRVASDHVRFESLLVQEGLLTLSTLEILLL